MADAVIRHPDPPSAINKNKRSVRHSPSAIKNKSVLCHQERDDPREH